MVDLEFMQSHALFGGIPLNELEYILPILRECEFTTGSFIVKEGELGDCMYFILEGSVEILCRKKDTPENTDLVKLAELQAGDVFGEMELIDIQPRSASVRALEPVLALALTNHVMYSIYHDNLNLFTRIILNLAREISRKLRQMDTLVSSTLSAGEKKHNIRNKDPE